VDARERFGNAGRVYESSGGREEEGGGGERAPRVLRY